MSESDGRSAVRAKDKIEHYWNASKTYSTVGIEHYWNASKTYSTVGTAPVLTIYTIARLPRAKICVHLHTHPCA